MTDIEVITDIDAPEVPLVGPRRPAKVRVKRRGRVTKWLAIGWLAFITISAIGANSLPYISQDCPSNSKSCADALTSNLRLSQVPPA